jgi:hypothetical protein
MKVRTADGAARHLDDDVSSILDFRIGDVIAANIVGAVPAELYKSERLLRARWRRRRMRPAALVLLILATPRVVSTSAAAGTVPAGNGLINA